MDLDLLKKHLRIEHCDDDYYLEMLYAAVKKQAEGYLDAAIVDVLVDGNREVLFNKSIELAIFIGVCHIYENRGDDSRDLVSVSKHDLPVSFHSLLLNQRDFSNAGG